MKTPNQSFVRRRLSFPSVHVFEYLREAPLRLRLPRAQTDEKRTVIA
jgi:hypothetical protein